MKKYLVDNKYIDNKQKAINRFAKRILTKGKSEIKVYNEPSSKEDEGKYETLDYFNQNEFVESYLWKKFDNKVVNVFVDKDDKITVRTKPKPKKGELHYMISLAVIKDYCLTFQNLRNDTGNNKVSMSLTFGKPKNIEEYRYE